MYSVLCVWCVSTALLWLLELTACDSVCRPHGGDGEPTARTDRKWDFFLNKPLFKTQHNGKPNSLTTVNRYGIVPPGYPNIVQRNFSTFVLIPLVEIKSVQKSENKLEQNNNNRKVN